MKKLIFLLLLPALVFSQNLVFIGENSYPSSKVLVFENKYDDVEISFIRDEDNIKVYLLTNYIYGYKKPSVSDKLILYLNDGNVITSNKPDITDYVDKNCVSIYPLTNDDISKLTKSDINTIRYTIVTSSTYENEARTAKNTKLGTYEIIKDIL